MERNFDQIQQNKSSIENVDSRKTKQELLREKHGFFNEEIDLDATEQKFIALLPGHNNDSDGSEYLFNEVEEPNLRKKIKTETGKPLAIRTQYQKAKQQFYQDYPKNADESDAAYKERFIQQYGDLHETHRKVCQERNKKSYEKNKDAAAARNLNWRKANPEKLKASKKKSYEKNKDTIRNKIAEWTKANPEKCKKYYKKNYQKNKIISELLFDTLTKRGIIKDEYNYNKAHKNKKAKWQHVDFQKKYKTLRFQIAQDCEIYMKENDVIDKNSDEYKKLQILVENYRINI